MAVLVSCTGANDKVLPVNGRLTRSGGPTGAPAGVDTHCCPHYEANVQLHFVPIHQSGNTRATNVTTDRFGGFSLRLRPGTYRVEVPGPGADSFVDGKPIQPSPNLISVKTGAVNQFNLVISIR